MSNWLITIYFAGLLIILLTSIQSFADFKALKKRLDIDAFQIRPDLLRYLFLKPLIWPYYCIIEKNPLEYFSELFFKHYGDDNHTYYGTQGLKHFINDCFRGKNRYDKYQVYILNWPLVPDSELYRQFSPTMINSQFGIILIVAINNNKALLRIVYSDKSYQPNYCPSRYELDDCEKMSVSELKDRLFKINSDEATRFLSLLS